MSSQVEQQISDFLQKEYLQDYITLLGIVTGITNHYPQQADSQVRNAFTHLARGIENPEEFENELHKAKGHLERAKRDCIKLAIIYKKKDIENEIKSIRFSRGGLSEDIKVRRMNIAFLQQKAYIQESIGNKETSVMLENILTELIALEKEIINFDKIAKKPYKSVKAALLLMKIMKTLFYMVSLASIGLAIREYLLPYIRAYFQF